mmetsp:Transcript_3508/g.5239  ORF Transcript_3508/g.5239 Transcript_3508/m.5239 type:complete len:494 (-) Transcript_3508:177-1658(-)|eukprot:CAMPEP_0167753142 /NCGR_PEP_ID=MMETSP0110_2-20121227/7542_1 /TAXON_ID=629695 /ORGANISM="Gymnochlora sp., Strain CCMP2014" /LENGTH=493 /DNA_ID=CAMNT_0007638861 /DNA_START=67 /DNA_END=1548 /DNA_ORIENTATION=+
MTELSTYSRAVNEFIKSLPERNHENVFKKLVEASVERKKIQEKEIVSAFNIIIENLNIPAYYAILEDQRTFNPSEVSNLERKAKSYQSISGVLLSAWHIMLKNWVKERTSGCEILWDMGMAIFVAAAHAAQDTEWGNVKSRKEAKEIIGLLLKCDNIANEDSIGTLQERYGKNVLKRLSKRMKTVSSERDTIESEFRDVVFGPVFEWTVTGIRHPVISDIFSTLVLSKIVWLIDSVHLPTKAIGIRVLSYCAKELLTTEVRFHSSLFLHRILQALNFKKVEVEPAVIDCVIVLLPRLSLSDVQNRPLVMQVLEEVSKAVEWISMSLGDEPLPRVVAMAERLPRVITMFGHHNARFFRTLFPSIVRFGLSSDCQISLLGTKAMIRLFRAIPTRVRAHIGKFMECLASIHIRHLLKSELKEKKIVSESLKVEVRRKSPPARTDSSEKKAHRQAVIEAFRSLQEVLNDDAEYQRWFSQVENLIPGLDGVYLQNKRK